MSWEFIVSLIVAAIGAVVLGLVLAFTPKTKEKRERAGYGQPETVTQVPNPDRQDGVRVARIIFIVAGVFLALASFTTIGTRNIGIETQFNRPTGTLDNGWHLIAPWTKVSEWDGKLQNLRFSNGEEKDKFGPAVPVRLGNQSTATIDLQLQYRLTTDHGVLELYRQYGSEDSVTRNLILKELQAALNQVFATYDPIVHLAQAGADRAPDQGMPELAEETENLLRTRMPEGIEIVSVNIVMPHYDQQTEDRIQAFNAAIQETAIAKQREETAKAIREANEILAESNASPAVLLQNCLDMVERVVKSGGRLPEAFTCNGGGAVVLPAVGSQQ